MHHINTHTSSAIRVAGVLLVPFLLAFGALAGAEPRESDEAWVELRSPHFVVISNASELSARECAQQFERIRATYSMMLPNARVDPDKPILIAAVSGEAALKRLLPQYWADEGRVKPVGAFVDGVDKYFVIVRLDVDERDAYRAVYHEYFHLLVSLNLTKVPLWLQEGLAEFWSNTDFVGPSVRMGRANVAHIERLRNTELLPLEELLQVVPSSAYYNESQRASVFYAQSWALVHYMMLGDRSGDSQKALRRYLALLDQGVDGLSAFRQVFGNLTVRQAELRDYVKRSQFPVYEMKAPAAVNEVELSVRALSKAEALALQGNFLALSGRLGDASLIIERAMQSDPSVALAHESMGLLELTYRRSRSAAKWFASAVAHGSKNYFAHYQLAKELAEKTPHDSAISNSEEHLRTAIRLNPDFAPAYAAMADVYLRRAGGTEQALEFAHHAIRLAPQQAKYRLDLAYMLLMLERREEARIEAEKAFELARFSSEQRDATRLLEQLRP